METGNLAVSSRGAKQRRESPSEASLAVAKRRSPVLSKSDYETIIPSGSKLTSVDRYSLQQIISFLETKHFTLLLLVGNVTLCLALKSVVNAYSYVELTPFFVEKDKDDFYYMPWPRLLSEPLPMLNTLIIDSVDARWNNANLSALPKTLTKISLRHTSLIVSDGLAGLVVDLPNLRDLTIVDLEVVNLEEEYIFLSNWIPGLLTKSMQLASFVYYNNWRDDCYNPRSIAKSLPESLQFLKAGELVLRFVDFRRLHQLHTLEWLAHTVRDEVTPYQKDFVLPNSLTRLHLGNFGTDTGLYNCIRLAPATLLHLSIDADYAFCTIQVREYVRFTQLQSLIQSASVDKLDSQDFSLLPRSLVEVSDLFATFPKQWCQLPKNLRLVEPKHEMVDDHSDPGFTPQHAADEECSPYFPTNLFGIELHNVVPPNPFVGLRRATCNFVDNPMDGSPYHSIEKVISAVACPTLTELNINMDAVSFTLFPLTNYKQHLTNLVRLSVNYLPSAETRLGADDLQLWFKSIPTSVCCLKLVLFNGVDKTSKKRTLHLGDGLLGPNLTSLSLTFGGILIEFPHIMPSSLNDLTLCCSGFSPRLVDHNLRGLPHSLTSVTLSATKESESICFSKEAIEHFEQHMSVIKRRRLYIPSGLCVK